MIHWIRARPIGTFYLFFTFSLRLVNISQNFFFFSGPWWRMAMIYRDLVRARLWFEFQFCDVTSLVLKKKEEFLSVSLRNWGRATKESRRDFLLSVVDSSPSPSVFEFSIVDKSITSRTRDTATTVRERFLVLILPSSVGNHGDARHPYAQHTRMTHRLSLRWCKLLICYFHPR